MPGICLIAAGTTIHLGVSVLTLAWTHSVEKVRWEEDWRATSAGLIITEDRVQGTGAGMEPAKDASFDGKWWHYRPKLPPIPQVVLRRSGTTVSDWSICIGGVCDSISNYIAATADPVIMAKCE